MVEYPLQSLAAYSHFVAELLDRSGVERSTVVVWPASPYTGIAEGEVHFSHGIRLRLREELDFDEVYRHDERLYGYDDFPHPNNATLATTFPHHKHVPPDIKHNRIPAPEMSFSRPNLPILLQEIEEVITGLNDIHIA